MKKRLILFILITAFALPRLVAQTRLGVYAAGFYNLENLFDTIDDPGPGDDEFTPAGAYNWTQDKYEKKLRNMATVISRLGREVCPAGPAFLGVSEVENRRVLEDLVKTEPMASMGYEIVHYDSPDRRGIDVALLYNPKLFKVTSSQVYPYRYPNDTTYRTRDQLLVSGTLAGKPFHVIVNHWPSRYGGDKSSVFREFAASITKHITDSIRTADPAAKVLIVGDLNDDPDNKSCREVLKARKKQSEVEPDGLFNATWGLFEKGIGSLCYQNQWNLFDQLIISANLLGKDRSTLKYWKAEIFNRDFLLQKEGKYKGYPLRTFSGNVFQNGYSDHLPSLIYFVKEIR
ncbi:MAG: endonuclease/exonuclease/phosphatase family protein [Bacteroides sp.]|nr:endonuclease/exonuclease/phosphatase family protein [Bacteroides sp.]